MLSFKSRVISECTKYENQSCSLISFFLEVMGAIFSVLIIWVLTGVLVYKAVLRIVNGEHNINAGIMLIVAASGVGVNIT